MRGWGARSSGRAERVGAVINLSPDCHQSVAKRAGAGLSRRKQGGTSTVMMSRPHRAHYRVAVAMLLASCPVPAAAQTVQELQRQIDELKAQIKALTEAQNGTATAAAPPPAQAAPVAPPAPQMAASAPVPSEPAPRIAAAKPPSARAPWYERLRLRGRRHRNEDSPPGPGARRGLPAAGRAARRDGETAQGQQKGSYAAAVVQTVDSNCSPAH